MTDIRQPGSGSIVQPLADQVNAPAVGRTLAEVPGLDYHPVRASDVDDGDFQGEERSWMDKLVDMIIRMLSKLGD